MTLIVSVISADGIVIAGDSLSSVKVNFQGNIGQATYSYTEKVSPFLENFGIGVFGSGLIGSHSVNFLIRSFEHSLKAQNRTIDSVTDLAEEIGVNLHNLLKKQIEIEKKSLEDFPKNHTFLGFQVVGYDEFKPKIIEVSLGRNVICKPFEKLGCYASGNREVVTAIWKLYKSKPGIHPIYEVFSLQEAIDYVDFLISSTISFQRFSPITANVGGEIDIALVRPFGEFQWIRQKPLGELLDGGKHETTKNIKSVNTYSEQEIQIILSLDYSTTPAGSEIFNPLKVPSNYRTVPIGPEDLSQSKGSGDSEAIHSQVVKIEDPRFEETYTAYVTRTSTGWSGRVPDVPEVNKCEEVTKHALLATLKDNLYEALKTRSDAWDKQIEEDIEAGKLDHLREEALEEIKTGKAIDL